MEDVFEIKEFSKFEKIRDKGINILIIVFQIALFIMTLIEIRNVIYFNHDAGVLIGLIMSLSMFVPLSLQYYFSLKERSVVKIVFHIDIRIEKNEIEITTSKGNIVIEKLSNVKYSYSKGLIQNLIIKGKKYMGVMDLKNYELFESLIKKHCSKSMFWSDVF